MSAIERSNHQWVNDLQHDNPTRMQTIADLLEHLERGIYHYLSHERSDTAERPGEERRQIALSFAEASLAEVLNNLVLFRGTSRVITWAAKLAARVSTDGLRSADCPGTAADGLPPAFDHRSSKVSNTFPID